MNYQLKITDHHSGNVHESPHASKGECAVVVALASACMITLADASGEEIEFDNVPGADDVELHMTARIDGEVAFSIDAVPASTLH